MSWKEHLGDPRGDQADLVSGLKDLFFHLSSRRRKQLLMLLGLMLIASIAEVFALGAIVPFLAFLADPELAAKQPLLSHLLANFGSMDHNTMLAAVSGLFIVAVIIAAAIRLLLAYANLRFVFGVGFELGVKTYRNTLSRPYRFHLERNSSEILALINKVHIVVTFVLMPLMQAATSIAITTFIFAALVYIDSVVALASAFGFGVIYLIVSQVFRKKLHAHGKVIAETQNQRVQAMQEGLGGIRDVLLDNSQEIYVNRYKEVDARYREAEASSRFIGQAPRFVLEAVGMAFIVVIALVLMQQSGGIATALPVLGALALGVQKSLPLLQLAYNSWTRLSTGRAVLADVLELLEPQNQPIAHDENEQLASPPIEYKRDINLNNISFRYRDDLDDALDGIELTISKGQTVGFIGKTGSGKSTLIDIVMGLLEPTSGSLEVDGIPITSNNRLGWKSHIAHVPQAIYLSDATMLENIAFGVPLDKIDEKRVHAAAKQAQIHDFILGQPDGYAGMVGERGVRLSGGQRQRIGIARALYKGADVLILDEATSALDDATEDAVIKSVEQLDASLTTLMIAHRLTTLSGCDLIVEMAHGKIIRTGSYADIVLSKKDASASQEA